MPAKKAKKAAKKKTTNKKKVAANKPVAIKAGPSPYVSVRRSPIHGNGVYAKKDIPEGAKIIQYVGNRLTKAQSDVRADEIEKQAKRYGSGAVYIFTLNNRYDIDGSVSWNKARFINHACETNCESDIIKGEIWIVATRDIKKGEELFYDYGYDLLNFLDHPCLCGQKDCVGFIVAEDKREDMREKITEIKEDYAKLKKAGMA